VIEISTRREFLPVSLTIINKDGSLARNCGNGLRCATRSVLRRLELAGTDQNEFPPAIEWKIEGRIFWCKVLDDGMTAVEIDDVQVKPVQRSGAIWREMEDAAKEDAEILRTSESATLVNTGNLHLVLFSRPASPDLIEAFAAQIQHVAGWDGINVHFAWPADSSSERIRAFQRKARINIETSWNAIPWERGAGLTQACGSGAVAIAAAAAGGMQGEEDWTEIRMPGGDLLAHPNAAAWTLVGPAHLVFTGTIEI
jgi:diaminopimelate epimerase